MNIPEVKAQPTTPGAKRQGGVRRTKSGSGGNGTPRSTSPKRPQRTKASQNSDPSSPVKKKAEKPLFKVETPVTKTRQRSEGRRLQDNVKWTIHVDTPGGHCEKQKLNIVRGIDDYRPNQKNGSEKYRHRNSPTRSRSASMPNVPPKQSAFSKAPMDHQTQPVSSQDPKQQHRSASLSNTETMVNMDPSLILKGLKQENTADEPKEKENKNTLLSHLSFSSNETDIHLLEETNRIDDTLLPSSSTRISASAPQIPTRTISKTISSRLKRLPKVNQSGTSNGGIGASSSQSVISGDETLWNSDHFSVDVDELNIESLCDKAEFEEESERTEDEYLAEVFAKVHMATIASTNGSISSKQRAVDLATKERETLLLETPSRKEPKKGVKSLFQETGAATGKSNRVVPVSPSKQSRPNTSSRKKQHIQKSQKKYNEIRNQRKKNFDELKTEAEPLAEEDEEEENEIEEPNDLLESPTWKARISDLGIGRGSKKYLDEADTIEGSSDFLHLSVSDMREEDANVEEPPATTEEDHIDDGGMFAVFMKAATPAGVSGKTPLRRPSLIVPDPSGDTTNTEARSTDENVEMEDDDDGGMLAVLIRAGKANDTARLPPLRRPSLIAPLPTTEQNRRCEVDNRVESDGEISDSNGDDDGGMLAVLLKAGMKAGVEGPSTLKRPSAVATLPTNNDLENKNETVDDDGGMLAVLMKAGKTIDHGRKTPLRRPSMIDSDTGSPPSTSASLDREPNHQSLEGVEESPFYPEDDDGGMLAVLMKAGKNNGAANKTTLRRPSMIAAPSANEANGQPIRNYQDTGPLGQNVPTDPKSPERQNERKHRKPADQKSKKSSSKVQQDGALQRKGKRNVKGTVKQAPVESVDGSSQNVSTHHDQSSRSTDPSLVSVGSKTSNTSDTSKYSYGVDIPGLKNITKSKSKANNPMEIPKSLEEQGSSTFIQLNLGGTENGVQVMNSDEIESKRFHSLDQSPLDSLEKEDKAEGGTSKTGLATNLSNGSSSMRNVVSALPSLRRRKTTTDVKTNTNSKNAKSKNKKLQEKIASIGRSTSFDESKDSTAPAKRKSLQIPTLRRTRSGFEGTDDGPRRRALMDDEGSMNVTDLATTPDGAEPKAGFLSASADFLKLRRSNNTKSGNATSNKNLLQKAQQSFSNLNFRANDMSNGELLSDGSDAGYSY